MPRIIKIQCPLGQEGIVIKHRAMEMVSTASMCLGFCQAVPMNQHNRDFFRRHDLSLSRQDFRLPVFACISSIRPSPLHQISFRGKLVYVKRDDMLIYKGLIGNKLRKFHSLMQPNALERIDTIISYGGSQSNAMLAISSLCQIHGKRFVYITRASSTRLSAIPGNYATALKAGMVHVELSNAEFRDLFVDKTPHELQTAAYRVLLRKGLITSSTRLLFIPQGGAWQGAEEGIQILSQELRTQLSYLRKNGRLRSKKPILFLAAGTGTTALYLQKHLHDVVRVVAIPVAGDERYLIRQMRLLQGHPLINRGDLHAPHMPDIIRPRNRSTFADVTAAKLSLWKELTRAANGEIVFDLVYAPKAWEEAMLAIAENRLGSGADDLLYYHSGGVEGNKSMLDRFRLKGLLNAYCP